MNSPRMRRFGKLLLVVFALACVLTTAAFAEGDAEVVSAVHGTIASLLPPVVAIGLALITKEVYSSLFIGIVVGVVFLFYKLNRERYYEILAKLKEKAE